MFFTRRQRIAINTYGSTPSATEYTGQQRLDGSQGNTIFWAYVRVKVCDNSVGLEPNCVQYGSNYKPEGLIQKYATPHPLQRLCAI